MTTTSTPRARLSRLIHRVAALALLLFVAGAASAATVYVDNTGGSNAFDGTSPQFQGGTTGPVETIAYAIQIASAGDTISIEAGNYPLGTYNLTKNVTFQVRPAGTFNQVRITGGTLTFSAASGFTAVGAGTFFLDYSRIDFETGAVNVGSGIVSLQNNVTLERTNGTASGSFVFPTTVNVLYNGTGDKTAGAELPSSLGNGTLTVNLSGTTPTLSFSQLTIGTGGIANVAAGNDISGTIVVAGSGVDLNGPGTFGAITVNSGNAVIDTDAGDITINAGELDFTTDANVGDVAINAGVLDANGNTLTLDGSFTRLQNGTFIASGSLAFDADGSVSINPGPNFELKTSRSSTARRSRS